MGLEIKLTPVKSAAIHSVGHSMGALYIRHHADDCASQQKKDSECNCAGHADIYKYPETSIEEHAGLIGAPSVGSHFAKLFRGRKFEKVKGES